MLCADLHTHTNCSDGELSPQDLVKRAIERKIDLLSITDHDTLAAYDQISWRKEPLNIICGVELSSQWNSCEIHIVGLNVDPESAEMKSTVSSQKEARIRRAVRIGSCLEKKGITGALEGARRLSGDGNIGRPHFARYLVESGRCRSISEAFKKYLSSLNLRQEWPSMATVINRIVLGGGVAVLAHPLKYKLTFSRLNVLCDEFIEAGGEAMEVVSGKQTDYQTQEMATLCTRKQLLASCGSDFHTPAAGWSELGQQPPLPAGCVPVWDAFT